MRDIALARVRGPCVQVCPVIDERTQQFIVARSVFVRSRDNRVDDVQSGSWPNFQPRESFAWSKPIANARGVLESSYDRSANCDHAPASRAGVLDCPHGGFGNPIRFVEREACIEFRVSGR